MLSVIDRVNFCDGDDDRSIFGVVRNSAVRNTGCSVRVWLMGVLSSFFVSVRYDGWSSVFLSGVFCRTNMC